MSEFNKFKNNCGLDEIKFDAFRYFDDKRFYTRSLDKITSSFFLPCITNTNELYEKNTPDYGYNIHIEKPRIINPNSEIKNQIKIIDSISGRRYLRIKEILEKMGKITINQSGNETEEDACYISNNKDYLYNTIPEYLRDDPQNEPYRVFVDMIGQHYDNIWIYYKDVTEKYNADNRLENGVSKDIVADAIRDFGIKLYQNNFSNEDWSLNFSILSSTIFFSFSTLFLEISLLNNLIITTLPSP